jgi:hypothetical protein
MNQAIIDTLQALLDGGLVGPENVHDGLLACLDLDRADDADVKELRCILQKMVVPAALDELQRDELQRALTRIRNRRLPR